VNLTSLHEHEAEARAAALRALLHERREADDRTRRELLCAAIAQAARVLVVLAGLLRRPSEASR
jgi:hypothetical protein